MSKEICVITFTVDRVPSLIRCINSVLLQDASVRHMVFSENQPQLLRDARLDFCRSTTEFFPLEGLPHQGPSSPRMAMLRQHALSFVREPYMCFLDDDNEMEAGHLNSLLAIIREQQVGAAYSWRSLLYADGKHFDGSSYPWHSDEQEAYKRWQWCIAAGVMMEGQSVMKDGPVAVPDPMQLATVDMNEWLFHTATLREIGLDFSFSEQDLRNRVGEDDKLFARIRSLQLPIAGSGIPSIRYYLGGVSNYRIN
ncbi:glycosyltransferase family A protein [Chitinophaga nivalis]|uniref:Glycosyltransferase family 2 protein n=1 Tax=Chitinophaga nivalis TaxID=2991709 RepID=A0ABT3IN14_9BACT|nr:glycosyltransferase family A protein [Chitinophaga nivalis]MCW3464963.1 glycosyltransferase family 2 protein [Chitinophaga nivalis]MCW3485345.1 glycosyltransferase family 2 protein [Chitinophaga nivalis]